MRAWATCPRRRRRQKDRTPTGHTPTQTQRRAATALPSTNPQPPPHAPHSLNQGLGVRACRCPHLVFAQEGRRVEADEAAGRVDQGAPAVDCVDHRISLRASAGRRAGAESQGVEWVWLGTGGPGGRLERRGAGGLGGGRGKWRTAACRRSVAWGAQPSHAGHPTRLPVSSPAAGRGVTTHPPPPSPPSPPRPRPPPHLHHPVDAVPRGRGDGAAQAADDARTDGRRLAAAHAQGEHGLADLRVRRGGWGQGGGRGCGHAGWATCVLAGGGATV